jgi:hypothetical protein
MSIDQLEIPYQRVLFHKFLDALKEEDEIYQAFLDLVYANEDLQSELEYIRNFSIYGKNAGKKMEQKVMSAVPFFLLGYMKLTAWDFICPLYGNPAGVLMMSISLMVYIGADYIAGKIVEIEV